MMHETWEKIYQDRDPQALWSLINQTHQLSFSSEAAVMTKKGPRDAYTSCEQGPFESIITFKDRFLHVLETYKGQGNPALEPINIAIDFFAALAIQVWSL